MPGVSLHEMSQSRHVERRSVWILLSNQKLFLFIIIWSESHCLLHKIGLVNEIRTKV